MRPIGFSTGAIAYSDFRRALALLAEAPATCIELSALRWPEVSPLLDAIHGLDVSQYTYVAFHAPSSFSDEQETELVKLLSKRVPREWPIILHPDTLHSVERWKQFGPQIAIENMDRRKPSGRSVRELDAIFARLPEASFCFDIGHARQCDTSMSEAYRILQRYGSRLRQVHVSEVNTASQHDPISYAAKVAFQQVASLIPEDTPIIVESRVPEDKISTEIGRVRDALTVVNQAQAIA